MIEFEGERDLFGEEDRTDLTPLIDMVFILLVFFLLTSFTLLPSIEFALPKAETGTVSIDEAITVAIAPDGRLELEGARVEEEELLEALGRLRTAYPERPVEVVADSSIPFGRVIAVTDTVRAAGAPSVRFLVERRR